MRIGVPREIKAQETRVGLTPNATHALATAGHAVRVQSGAGSAAGFSDADYIAAGAAVVDDAASAWDAELVVKVKEPQAAEYPLLRDGLILFTYLHLAAMPELTRVLLDRGITGIAYETVTDRHGRLPLLTPMSEVAGRIATQAGAHALHNITGGRGVLLGGVPGVAPGRVVVLGGGVVGLNAARIALGMGADTCLLDIDPERLRALDERFGPALKTRYADQKSIDELATRADLLIGAVLIPGHSAPKLIRRESVARMRPGAVIVDVAIDQGGCVETARATTHAEPTYIEAGVVHYAVANIPAACGRTATQALGNATLPYVLKLADRGIDALRDDPGLLRGLNVHRGRLTHPAVAESLGLELTPAEQALSH
ncbi:MAG TPA: alanine dehydrogenase [Chromatiaceae bacterium]|nr:alanine dehydrogenase [Chromatiaceae bacterium]